MNAPRISTDIDWTGCDFVEAIPGKVSGRPIVRGTRILADTIVQDAELGYSIDEIRENYPDLSTITIQALLAFGSRLWMNVSEDPSSQLLSSGGDISRTASC